MTSLASVLSFLRRRIWLILGVAVVLFFVLAIYSLTRPKQPQYITATAQRGDLRQTVEAVGTIVSDRDLELQFAGTDIVSSVWVTEGQKVKAGERLAALRSGSVGANVASASASVQSALAALQALQEGSRPEDIAIVEASVANKRAALQSAQQTLKTAEENLIIEQHKLDSVEQEAQVGLSGEVASTDSAIIQQLSTAKAALLATLGVFDQSEVQDVVVKSGSSDYPLIRSQMQSVIGTIGIQLAAGSHAADYQAALKNLAASRSATADASSVISRGYDLIASLSPNGYFTESKRETHKAAIALQRGYAQSALSALDGDIQALRNLSASYDTKIVAEQGTISSLKGTRDKATSDIQTYQTALQIEEAQLALKKAPARETDINAATARVRQAQADLARAASQYRDTILVAPVDGIVTKVNAKAGEIRPMSEPSVKMLGSAPFRIEMFVSEVDIPKVKVSQTGSVKLDAFRSTNYQLRVSEIDPAPTKVDGVDKYRVLLDFRYLHDDFKIGMSGDVTIITGERRDVITVPSRAIVEEDAKKVVHMLGAKGTVVSKEVVVGMEGEGGDTEILSGLAAGDSVITLTKK